MFSNSILVIMDSCCCCRIVRKENDPDEIFPDCSFEIKICWDFENSLTKVDNKSIKF